MTPGRQSPGIVRRNRTLIPPANLHPKRGGPFAIGAAPFACVQGTYAGFSRVQKAGDDQVGSESCCRSCIIGQHAAHACSHEDKGPPVVFLPDQINHKLLPVCVSHPFRMGDGCAAVPGEIGHRYAGPQLREVGGIGPHCRAIAARAVHKQHAHGSLRMTNTLDMKDGVPLLPAESRLRDDLPERRRNVFFIAPAMTDFFRRLLCFPEKLRLR